MIVSAFLRNSFTQWSFPVRTLVGAGSRRQIPDVLASSGKSRPLVVTDPGLSKQNFFTMLLDEFRQSGLDPVAFTSVHPNPLDTDIEQGAAMYKSQSADSVVCIGGGSAMDAGKSIAMVAESGLSLLECNYFEASPQLPAGGRLVPCVTVPTTAGTGAEMDSGSMYTDTSARVKRCAGHTSLPLTAVLDPELTIGLPPTLTAWTGIDALVHAIEAYFVPEYHPMCDGIALQALQRIKIHLPRAYADGGNLDSRKEMLVASAMAAVAFQKGLGAVHGISEPFGAVYDTHHGLTNAILLPYILRDLGGVIEEPCTAIAHALKLPGAGSSAAAVISWVEELNEQLSIPKDLSQLVSFDDVALQSIAEKAATNPTGFTNIVPFGAADNARVLRAARG